MDDVLITLVTLLLLKGRDRLQMPRRLNSKRFRGKMNANWGDRSSAEKHPAAAPDLGDMVTITDEHIAHAGRFPPMSWPVRNILFPVRRPGDSSTDPVFRSGNLRNPPEYRGWRRGDNVDPLTEALQFVGASHAGPHTFRMVSVDYATQCLLVGRKLQAWASPDGLAQDPGRHAWRPGA